MTTVEMKPYRKQKAWLTLELLHSAPTARFTTADGANGAQLEHPRGGPLTWVKCPHSNVIGVTRIDNKWHWLIDDAAIAPQGEKNA